MKNNLTKKTLGKLVFAASFALASSAALAIGPVSSPGWYYTTIQYTTSGYNYGRVGPFSDKPSCQSARSADYGDGGAIPWDGGPGCFYLYENEIGAFNEILEHWNLASGPNSGVPHIELEANELLASVNVLIEHHAIKEYRSSMNKLSNISEEAPRRNK